MKNLTLLWPAAEFFTPSPCFSDAVLERDTDCGVLCGPHLTETLVISENGFRPRLKQGGSRWLHNTALRHKDNTDILSAPGNLRGTGR